MNRARTRLTKDEQRTLLTLWSIFRSPLIMGGNLLLCDEWLKSLLTNAEVIAVDQHSKGNHAVETTANFAVWVAEQDGADGHYVAVFNRSDAAETLHYAWKQLGLNDQEYAVRDLWEQKDLGRKASLQAALPAHGAALYLVRAQATP